MISDLWNRSSTHFFKRERERTDTLFKVDLTDVYYVSPNGSLKTMAVTFLFFLDQLKSPLSNKHSSVILTSGHQAMTRHWANKNRLLPANQSGSQPFHNQVIESNCAESSRPGWSVLIEFSFLKVRREKCVFNFCALSAFYLYSINHLYTLHRVAWTGRRLQHSLPSEVFISHGRLWFDSNEQETWVAVMMMVGFLNFNINKDPNHSVHSFARSLVRLMISWRLGKKKEEI